MGNCNLALAVLFGKVSTQNGALIVLPQISSLVL